MQFMRHQTIGLELNSGIDRSGRSCFYRLKHRQGSTFGHGRGTVAIHAG
jgi:hypothetical protein